MMEPNKWLGLEGSRIVVTGGSSGIGKATCVLLGSLGAHVAVHYCSNQQGADSTVEEITRRDGHAFAVQGDLQEAPHRQRLIDQCWDRLGNVDSWVHNAGADVLTGVGASLSFEDKIDCLWQVDVRGTMLLAREVASRMMDQTDNMSNRSMVFTGWDQAPEGMEGDPGQVFGPVKAAVMALSRNAAQSFAPKIRVNCVAPGWIQTAWGEQTDDRWNRRAIHSSLLERWGTGEDVASVVAFLCSRAASFVNAQVIEVNGGWNRRVQQSDPN